MQPFTEQSHAVMLEKSRKEKRYQDNIIQFESVWEILHLLSVLQKSDLIFLIKEAFLNNAIATRDLSCPNDPEA